MSALDEIRAMTCDVITPRIAARVLHCDPYNINLAARYQPHLLGFPVFFVGSRCKIPRLAFIRAMEGK